MATRDEIAQALRNAHAAGDIEAAKKLAAAYAATSQTPELTDTEPTSELSDAAKRVYDMSGLQQYHQGMLAGIKHDARGVGQRLGELMPDGMAQRFGLPTASDETAARSEDAPIKATIPGLGGYLMGETIPALPLPGGTMAKAVLSGGLLGYTTPTTENESVAGNTISGAGGGLIGHALMALGGRALRPVRSELPSGEAALAREAQDKFGIPLSAAQLTGSKPLLSIDKVLDNLPLTGGGQQAEKAAQLEAFNRAVGNTFGSPEGKLTEDVMAAAKNRIGGAIGDIADRNKFNLDNQAFNDIVSRKFDSQRFDTGDVQNIVNNYIDDFFSKVEPNGTVSGEAYRKLDSALGRKARGTSNGDLRSALGDLRGTLREGMDRSISPEDATTWADLRNQYRNMKLVDPVVAKSPSGDVSPNLLLGAAIKGDSNAAYKTSDLKDLGKIGKQYINVPQGSDTAQKTYYTKMLTDPAALFSGLLTGGGALGIPVQKMLWSKAGKKYLTKGILPGAQALEGPLLKYLAAPVGAESLLMLNSPD